MPDYVISVRFPAGFEPSPEAGEPWRKWFESLGTAVVDRGNPIFSRRGLGDTGPGTDLGGYSILRADSLDEAVAAVRDCPVLAVGGGVEVGEITPIM